MKILNDKLYLYYTTYTSKYYVNLLALTLVFAYVGLAPWLMSSRCIINTIIDHKIATKMPDKFPLAAALS